MKKRIRCGLLRSEHGASLVEMAVLMPLFMLLLLSSIDLGRAFYLAIEIAGAARTGALYGTKSPADTAGMKTAAQDDAPDVPNLSVGTASCSTECPDGTHLSTSCTATPTCASGLNYVYLVNVTVTASYTPIFPWPGVPSFSFSSSAAMRSLGSS